VTALAYHNLSLLYQEKDEYTRAEANFRKCLEIRRKVLGEERAETANAMFSLAQALKKLNQPTNAAALLERCLDSAT